MVAACAEVHLLTKHWEQHHGSQQQRAGHRVAYGKTQINSEHVAALLQAFSTLRRREHAAWLMLAECTVLIAMQWQPSRRSRCQTAITRCAAAQGGTQNMPGSTQYARLEVALLRALQMTGLALQQNTAAEHTRMLAAATRVEMQAFLRALGLAQLADADWAKVAAGPLLAYIVMRPLAWRKLRTVAAWTGSAAIISECRPYDNPDLQQGTVHMFACRPWGSRKKAQILRQHSRLALSVKTSHCAGTWRSAAEADSEALDPATEDRATDLLRRLLDKRQQLIKSLTEQRLRPLSPREAAGDGVHNGRQDPAPGVLMRSSSATAPINPLVGFTLFAVFSGGRLALPTARTGRCAGGPFRAGGSQKDARRKVRKQAQVRSLAGPTEHLQANHTS